MKNTVFIVLLFVFCGVSFGDATWVGNLSSDFWDAGNWSDSNLGADLTIGSSGVYDPVHSYETSIRPGALNTTKDANLTIRSGEIYPWTSDYLNGRVTVGVGAVLSIRNTLYLGRNDYSEITIDGGKLENKGGYAVYLGSGTGGHVSINLWSGTFYMGKKPTVGSADIAIGKTGSLYCPGNEVSFLNGLIDNGTITTYPDYILKVEYNAGSGLTKVFAEKIRSANTPNPWDDSQQTDIQALSWVSGTLANSSRVFFGPDYDSVYNATVSDSNLYLGSTSGNSINLDREIVNGYSYYWRVDSVTASGIEKGDVWKFKKVSSIYPRMMENLSRGVFALRKSSSTAFISWRLFGTDPDTIAFNLYRKRGSSSAVKLNDNPIVDSTNFIDDSYNYISSNTYYVCPVIDGVELEASESYVIPAYAPIKQYFDVPVQQVPGDINYSYFLNDAGVGDLDGDGEYEIVVKRLSTESFEYPVIDAYKMDGTFLWRVNLGPNFLSDVEINFCVYDFDCDGYAEVAVRSAEGTTFGDGGYINDVDGDGIVNYRSFSVDPGWIIKGPNFISMVDGRTGVELARDEYIERDPVGIWGDTYGHRANKPMMAAVYLDGHKPSLVISRGIYELTKLEGWNYRDGKLSKLWHFNSEEWPGFGYQGNHNLTTGDVDFDGRDEITYGGMAVDHDGTGLYTSGDGHGDAIHLSDMDPDRDGLELWRCVEGSATGITLRDAQSGELIFDYYNTADVGRAMAGDIDPRYRGYEMWGASNCPLYTCKGEIIGSAPSSMNFRIYWDGDLLTELLNHYGDTGSWYGVIDKWDYQNHILTPILSAVGTLSNNWTKGTPCIQADLFGDWREEVIWRRDDNRALRVYTTSDITEHRIYTLMHDPQYRQAVAWQINDYNQPPHPGFYLGVGMEPAPRPYIQLVGQDSRFVSLEIDSPDGVLSPGQKIVCLANVADIDGNPLDISDKVKWSVSGGGIIVEDTGLFIAGQASGKYTLTAEISDGYYGKATVDIVIASPITRGHWRLDDISGITAENTGNKYSDAGLEGGLNFDSDSLNGKLNQALSFDGDLDHIELPAMKFDMYNGLSLSMWVYPTDVRNWARFFDFGNGAESDNVLLGRFGSTNDLFFQVWDGNTSDGYVIASNAISLNQWQLFTVTIDLNGNVRLYKNAILIKTGNAQFPNDIVRTNCWIGKSNWSADEYFRGYVDDFWVHNYVLSPVEISNIADGGKVEGFSPADNETISNLDVVFGFSGIPSAIGYDVYLWADEFTVANANIDSPAYLGSFGNAEEMLPLLDFDVKYYWRVDAVTPLKVIRGDVLSFTTETVFDPIAWWQFRDGTDLITPFANMSINGTMTGGNVYDDGSINAENADYFGLAEGSGVSYSDISPVPDKLIEAANSSMTMFARVKMASFSGVDDVWRVGKGSCSSTGLGFAAQESYALELLSRRPRFVVSADGQVDGAEVETSISHSSYLFSNKWYDIVGVFTADPDTSNSIAQGSLKIYVFDPKTGLEVGSVRTLAVDFDKLETDFVGDISNNVLFGEAPCNANGTNNGQVIELAALWNRALSDKEVALLSRTIPLSPAFENNPIQKKDAVVSKEYLSTVSTDVVDADVAAEYLYEILDGPVWLESEIDGTLRGIPTQDDAGQNSAIIRFVDSLGNSDISNIVLSVFLQRDGSRGFEDYAVFASYWMQKDCGVCGGTDLDDNGEVDIYDLRIIAENWLMP